MASALIRSFVTTWRFQISVRRIQTTIPSNWRKLSTANPCAALPAEGGEWQFMSPDPTASGLPLLGQGKCGHLHFQGLCQSHVTGQVIGPMTCPAALPLRPERASQLSDQFECDRPAWVDCFARPHCNQPGQISHAQVIISALSG